MRFDIRELRESTGLTQKDFAAMYEIPLSTLRKWEQGEAAPPPYVLALIARTLPAAEASLQKITDGGDRCFYYDPNRKIVFDRQGSGIQIREELEGVKPQNLLLYLTTLFDGYTRVREKFERDCRYDKEEDILWR